MRNYRFSIHNTDELNAERIIINNPELIHQIRSVLKLKPESPEEITFIDGVNPVVYEVRIESIKTKQIIFKILRKSQSPRDAGPFVRFFVPVIKADAFETMIRMLTQLGVQEFIPTVFERSQKANVTKITSPGFRVRLEKIIREVTEQCEGAVFAKVLAPIGLGDITAEVSDEIKIYASERLSLSEVLGAAPKHDTSAYSKQDLLDKVYRANTQQRYSLVVGPEGGLSDKEVAALDTMGYQAVSLGARLLKAETAAVALCCKILRS